MSRFLKVGGFVVAFIAIAVCVLLVRTQGQSESPPGSRTTQEKPLSNTVELEKTNDHWKRLKQAAGAIDQKARDEARQNIQMPAASKNGQAQAKPAEKDVSDRFKAMAKVQATTQANLLYGQLFNKMNLPADAEEAARAILAKHFEIRLRILSGGNSNPEQIEAELIEVQKHMRDELSTVLTSDEMAMYDEYQNEMPRHMLEQQYEMQLNLAGTTLSPESRELVKQTLVEEMLAGIPNNGQPVPAADRQKPEEVLKAKLAAFERASQRLGAALDENEFAQAQRFLNQQRQQVQMAGELMGKAQNKAQ